MSFPAALAARFPAMAPTCNAIAKPTQSLEALSSELAMSRFQYWYRYITTYGETRAKGIAQAKIVASKMAAPADLTGKEVITGLVCGVHIYGAFTIGEMLGRKSIVGYSQGKKVHHH
eukprot:CAMPEP_0197538334 /NCGR_PEP_ID=MMETSP1318-20131121/59536_1 /TAXON_ID=552666 /ORGANISM="Partenskyella glossopodia, Strain RCC365" /LENGTH=116 /DNA_ID=CAMNT_0043096721 /DNA_START=71 /DNA_END=421 /DNA_ORIENTATION=-